MGSDVIQAKYDELDAIARRFGQRAQAIGELRSQVQRSAQPLEQGGWQGRGAAAFFSELNGQIVPATQRLRLALEEARSVTLEASAIMRRAEQEAGEAAAAAGRAGEAGEVAGTAGRAGEVGEAAGAASATAGEGAAAQATRAAGSPFQPGRTPKATDVARWAEEQGWKRTQTPNGPPKYVDENGIPRVTIKQGSPRTPGSETPHVELRDATGRRVDPSGNPVNRRSPGNHSPIDYDF